MLHYVILYYIILYYIILYYIILYYIMFIILKCFIFMLHHALFVLLLYLEVHPLAMEDINVMGSPYIEISTSLFHAK